MQKLIVLAAIVAVAVRAEDIAVCRQGQSITISIQSLSPYDEIGGCGASYFYIPATTSPAATAAPATVVLDPSTAMATPMPPSSGTPSPNDKPLATATPAATAAPSSNDMPLATSAPAATAAPVASAAPLPSATRLPSDKPSSSVVPTSAPASPIMTPTASPAIAAPLPASMIGTLGPNAIVPDNAVRPPSSALPPNDMPLPGNTVALPSTAGPTVGPAAEPNDHHEWQATGSFSHGHMESVIKANHAIPANADPNDPKTRVLVFLQFFTPTSVYDNPQQVFTFFTKPQDIHGQRLMRIN